MVVLGNPPYSVSSSNKGEWIQNLIVDYKRGLHERKINLDDDYIKFIRYGQYFIDKNGSGILAYISNNSFIDGITYRQMRRQLLESFDKIYILDLHGNAKKKEVSSDGTIDQNVFDIMQGVSINIFVKTGKRKKNQIGKVLHIDLQGNRDFKYDYLYKSSLKDSKWKILEVQEPNLFFVPKDFTSEGDYSKWIKLNDLMPINSSGIETKCDEISVRFTSDELDKNLQLFKDLDVEYLKKEFQQKKESSGWNFSKAKAEICSGRFSKHLLYYRPFDLRHSIITSQSGGFIGRSRFEVMRHFMYPNNMGIQICRQQSTYNFQHVLVTKCPVDRNSISLQTKESTYVFPLYLYNKADGQKSIDQTDDRTPNLNPEFVKQFSNILKINFINEKETTKNTFAPIDILDYIYSILHSPNYRVKYKEFLKIDFPRVPYPKDADTFWNLVKLGSSLRQIHLLESPLINKFITTYPVNGSNEVIKLKYEGSKVWINFDQYFDHVPQVAWEFYIGGYQPAQKWLKDRKGRVLSYEDIQHYQRIIVALAETDRLMKEIDKIEFS